MFLHHWHSSSTGADATDRGRRIHIIAPAFAFGAAPAVDRMEGTRTLRKNAQRTLTSAKHYQFARSNSVVPHICPFSLTLKLTHLYTDSPSRRPTPSRRQERTKEGHQARGSDPVSRRPRRKGGGRQDPTKDRCHLGQGQGGRVRHVGNIFPSSASVRRRSVAH